MRFIPKHYFITVLSLLVLCASCTPKTATLSTNHALMADVVYRVEANPKKGFHSPYFILIPPSALTALKEGQVSLAVFPNNTGWHDNGRVRHENFTIRWMERHKQEAEVAKSIMIAPGFPRPRDPEIYTHALSRDVLTTRTALYSRLDLQLSAIIEDARRLLSEVGVKTPDKSIMVGFSASGMFVSRYIALHPKKIMAAIIGAPGGWPLVPIAEYKGEQLPYPVGVADIEALTGQPFDKAAYCAIPKFFYIGDKDRNDSVPYEASFSSASASLVNKLFGGSPVARWGNAEDIFKKEGCNAVFKLYPGMGHRPNAQAIEDIIQFVKGIQEN